VTAIRGGVHAIERGRFRRADISAHVCSILYTNSCGLAVSGEHCGDGSQAVAGGGRGREVLGSVFGPFDGHAGLTADRREQTDVWKDCLFDANTSATARW